MMEMMEKLCFDDCEEFACAFSDLFKELKNKDEFDDVSVVAYYDDAKQIIAKLICMGHPIYDIHLCDPEIDAYVDEYYISLNSDGVWCERAIGDKGYLYTESAVTFVLDNCNSSVLQAIESEKVFEAHIGSCEDCDLNEDTETDDEELLLGYDDDCDECEFKYDCQDMEMTRVKGNNEDTDDYMPGFTISKSDGKSSTTISFYSTDKELVNTMAEFYR